MPLPRRRAKCSLLIGTLVLLPAVLGYTAFTYWLFHGKVREGAGVSLIHPGYCAGVTLPGLITPQPTRNCGNRPAPSARTCAQLRERDRGNRP